MVYLKVHCISSCYMCTRHCTVGASSFLTQKLKTSGLSAFLYFKTKYAQLTLTCLIILLVSWFPEFLLMLWKGFFKKSTNVNHSALNPFFKGVIRKHIYVNVCFKGQWNIRHTKEPLFLTGFQPHVLPSLANVLLRKLSLPNSFL